MTVRRGLMIAAVVAAAGAAILWFGLPTGTRVRPPIRVGLLHSLTGPMAISEAAMVDAEKLAVEGLNARGGLIGRRVEWVVADGKSDPSEFAREAERLISAEKVDVLVGCWTSDCRKAVKAVVERLDHLLIYPVAYEGMEESPNIVYTGAAPNQQVMPTVSWCANVLKAKSFYLIGSDSVGSHAVGAIVKDELSALGAGEAGEFYVAGRPGEMEAAVAAVLKAKPDVVLSTIEGEDNLPFYRAMKSAGVSVPVVSYSITEEEMRRLPTREMTNDYVVCNYFQSVDREENREFVRAFKARFGADRVTSDAVATAHTSVLLWAQAVEEAEVSGVREVRRALVRQSLDAPEGVVSVDRETQHTYRPFFVGKVRPDGQVDIVLTITKPIRPVPFPLSRTRGDWEAFLKALGSRRGGDAPAPRAG